MISRKQRLDTGEIALAEGTYILWQCPNCTWFRCRKNNTEWDNTIIYHPVYGNITLYYLYLKDINAHDCALTRSRRIHHGMDPDSDYEQYRSQRSREGLKELDRQIDAARKLGRPPASVRRAS